MKAEGPLGFERMYTLAGSASRCTANKTFAVFDCCAPQKVDATSMPGSGVAFGPDYSSWPAQQAPFA